METMGKTLMSMLLDGCLPGADSYFSQGVKPLQRRKKFRAPIENKPAVLLQRKTSQKKWFHYAVNLNLVALITMAFLLPLPGHLFTAYGFVCLVCGWIFYYTLDKMTFRILNKLSSDSTANPMVERGKLSKVAGKDLISRFVMVVLLVGILIATVQVHPVFSIALGLVARIMIESQIRIFISELSVQHQINEKKFSEKSIAKDG